MEGKLYKTQVLYFSASGPGAHRELCIPDLHLRIDETLRIRNDDIKYNNTIHASTKKVIYEYPYTPVHLSEKAKESIHALHESFLALEKAKEEYKNALKSFKDTEGGNEVNMILNPSPKLTLRDILTEESENKIKEDIERLGFKITSFTSKLEGYSQVQINIKFDKSKLPSQDDLTDFTSCGFKFSFSYMVGSKKGIYECNMINLDGQVYAPHYKEDIAEIAYNEYKQREVVEKYYEKMHKNIADAVEDAEECGGDCCCDSDSC